MPRAGGPAVQEAALGGAPALVAVRAGRLRDELAGRPAAAPSAGDPGGPPPARAMGTEPVTLAGDPATLAGEPATLPEERATLAGWAAPAAAPGHRRPLWDRKRPGRGVVLALAGVAVVAGVAGWLAGAFGAGPPQARPGAAAPAVHSSGAPAAHTVEVDAGVLAGQRASAVSQRLRQLGLRPHVVRAVRGGQAPGTVISIRPSGQVPAGSAVTVTAAVRPPGHGNRNGNGNDGGG